MSAGLHRRDVWAATGHQLRRPDGRAGWVLGHLMSHFNWKPYLAAIHHLDIRPDHHVLELGFGSGRGLKRVLTHLDGGMLTAVDHSPTMVAMARRKNAAAIHASRLDLREGPFSPLPFADQSFDRILAVNVAYFFDRAGRDMRDCFRVLKGGGRLCLYVTERATMEKWRFCEAETHRTFDRAEAVGLLTEAGFARGAIEVLPVSLGFGIRGLVLTATR